MEAEVSESVVSAAALKTWRMRIEQSDRTFEGLKKLKLRGKELGRPAPEIFHLTELQVLDLSPERQACLFYHLPEVPPAIARLRNLRVLMLDTNDLRELPPQLGHLSNLERLSLSNNLLTSLPDNLAHLRSLTSLHAANNEFQQIPECLYAMTSLRFLDFSDNSLLSLSERLACLERLESLLLFANLLRALPSNIGLLTDLRCLWVGNNRLRSLPHSVTALEKLDWGRLHTWSPALDGNPLKDPPLDVCKRGVTAIETYFRQRSDVTSQ